MAVYRWADDVGRFRDDTGRFVTEKAVRAVVDAISDGASERMVRASERLLGGEISLAAWQGEMQQLIRLAHISASVLAHGGRDRMTPARWGSAGRAIRTEYGYLADFAQSVADGVQPLNGTLPSRAAQYGQQARVAYHRAFGRDQRERGYTHERNVLAASEHCSGCKAQTARGQVDIGALVPVGRRACRAQCRCRIEYARAAAARRAA